MSLNYYLKHRRAFEATFCLMITLLFGLVSATSRIIENVRDGYPSRWIVAQGTELTATLSVLLLIPFLVWFLRVLKLDWSNFRWRILWHIPAFVCFSLAHVALFVALRKIIWSSVGSAYYFGPLLLGLLYEMRKGLLIYVGLVLLILAYQFILDRMQGEAGFIDVETDEKQPYTDQFLVKMLNKEFLVKSDSIDWAQSASNYVLLHCDKRSFPMRQTMSGLAEQLNPRQFVRVHRTAIIYDGPCFTTISNHGDKCDQSTSNQKTMCWCDPEFERADHQHCHSRRMGSIRWCRW